MNDDTFETVWITVWFAWPVVGAIVVRGIDCLEALNRAPTGKRRQVLIVFAALGAVAASLSFVFREEGIPFVYAFFAALLAPLFLFWLNEFTPEPKRAFFSFELNGRGIIRCTLIAPLHLYRILTKTIARIATSLHELFSPLAEAVIVLLTGLSEALLGLVVALSSLALMLVGFVFFIWLIKTIWYAV
jgi:hypothetical protein